MDFFRKLIRILSAESAEQLLNGAVGPYSVIAMAVVCAVDAFPERHGL